MGKEKTVIFAMSKGNDTGPAVSGKLKTFIIMKYFKNISSVNELRKEYRILAIKNHPDKGGDTEIMQNINAEFAIAIYCISYIGRSTKVRIK